MALANITKTARSDKKAAGSDKCLTTSMVRSICKFVGKSSSLKYTKTALKNVKILFRKGIAASLVGGAILEKFKAVALKTP